MTYLKYQSILAIAIKIKCQQVIQKSAEIRPKKVFNQRAFKEYIALTNEYSDLLTKSCNLYRLMIENKAQPNYEIESLFLV
ncbi:MAG: hypothetical protein NVSMB24_28460 [Mucilaginibacter sp.]